MFFPLALPFKVCESNVLVAVLPVHSVPSFVHLLYEVLSASGCLSAVHNRQCYILNIALYLALLGLFEQLIGVLAERYRFLSLLSVKGLSLFGNMQPVFRAKLVGIIFHGLQLCLALLELVAVYIAHAVHHKMRVDMLLVLMGSNQHLKVLPLRS